MPNFFPSIPYVLTKADAYANSATLPYDSIDIAAHSTFVELLYGVIHYKHLSKFFVGNPNL